MSSLCQVRADTNPVIEKFNFQSSKLFSTLTVTRKNPFQIGCADRIFAFWSKFSYGQRSKCADLRNSYLLFSIYSTSLRVPLYGLAPKDSLQLTGKDPPHSHAEFPRPDSADRSHGFHPVRQLRQVCIINQNLNYLSIFSTRLNFVCLGHNYRGG